MIGGRGIPATHGGVERAVQELSVRLAARGHEVTVFCRTPYCPQQLPEYQGVRLRYLPCVNTKHLEAFSHTALAVGETAVRNEFDIFHFHATGPTAFGVVPSLLGRPVVATMQGLDYRRAKWGPVASAYLRLCARLAATLPRETIVVSRMLERHCRERYGRTTTYIPNGVPPAPDAPLETHNPFGLEPENYVLFLSRLVPEKGAHTLIEAYRGLDTEIPLAVCGEPTHSESYHARLRALAGGDPRIRFLGGVYGDLKERLLHSALVYVHPSEIEGLPIALLEAMAHGRCVLTSDIEENLEALGTEPRAGEAFRSGDAESLRERLRHLLDAADERERLGRLALDRVRAEYDWDRITAMTEQVYHRVAS